jgi:ABC-type transporter Mla MlaB component
MTTNYQLQEISMNDKYYGWRDGLPTAPDVTMIQKHWPDLEIGARIPYDEVAALIGVPVSSVRFRTVTKAWREKEKQERRVIKCDKSIAFYVATAEQITSDTFGALRHIGRSAKKQRTNLSTITDVDDRMRGIVNHQAMFFRAIEKDANHKKLNTLPDKSTPQVPRIVPPLASKAA